MLALKLQRRSMAAEGYVQLRCRCVELLELTLMELTVLPLNRLFSLRQISTSNMNTTIYSAADVDS